MAGAAKSPETRTFSERPGCGECMYRLNKNGKGSSHINGSCYFCLGTKVPRYTAGSVGATV